MTRKATYEELEQKLTLLKNEVLDLETVEKDLRIFKAAVESSINAIGLTDLEGKLLYVNESCVKMWGYNSEEEILGRFLPEFWDGDGILQTVKELFQKGSASGEDVGKRKDGTTFYVQFTATMFKDASGKPSYMFGSFFDITERKQAEKELNKAYDELERNVEQRTIELMNTNKRLTKEIENRKRTESALKEKTINLEETNTALKVLLENRRADRTEVEESMLLNVKELLEPFMVKLKQSGLSSRQITIVDVIDSNLKDITSPFARKFSSKQHSLTPTELKVANFIKHGKCSKEVASVLNLSLKTVKNHRGNIRKKLNLTNKRINLRSYLLSRS